MLVALRMTGPQDQAAIAEWVKHHGDQDKRGELMAALPSLPVGTAVIWSPGWLELFSRVAVRKRRTFDSSATPKVGQRQRQLEPQARAEVDLEQLRRRMATTIERSAAQDPAQLRARIGELEAELRVARAAKPTPEWVEVPVLDEEQRAHLETTLKDLHASRDGLVELLEALEGRLQDLSTRYGAPAAVTSPVALPTPSGAGRGRRGARREPAVGVPVAPTAADEDEGAGAQEVRLKAGARRILAALARHHPMSVTRAQAGALSGFKTSGGAFQSYWSALKTAGLIEEVNGRVTVTPAGLASAGVQAASPTSTEELLELWRGALKAGARTMLDLLVEAYPEGISRDELGERAGYSVSGGAFQAPTPTAASPSPATGPATTSSPPDLARQHQRAL